jgi:hypothetical protein
LQEYYPHTLGVAIFSEIVGAILFVMNKPIGAWMLVRSSFNYMQCAVQPLQTLQTLQTMCSVNHSLPEVQVVDTYVVLATFLKLCHVIA